MRRFSLSPRIACPVCHRPYREGLPGADGTMFPRCQGKECCVTWWAGELFEGDLLTQLQMTFGRQGGIVVMSSLLDPPERLKEIMYLQIVISGRELHRYRSGESGELRTFLTKLLREAA